LSGTLLLVVLFRLVAKPGGFQELAAGAYLNVQGHSPFFSMLMIAAEEKEIELPFTVDTRKRCRALVSVLGD